jgi:hypothetical protein
MLYLSTSPKEETYISWSTYCLLFLSNVFVCFLRLSRSGGISFEQETFGFVKNWRNMLARRLVEASQLDVHFPTPLFSKSEGIVSPAADQTAADRVGTASQDSAFPHRRPETDRAEHPDRPSRAVG